jgi:hypothetical protein
MFYLSCTLEYSIVAIFWQMKDGLVNLALKFPKSANMTLTQFSLKNLNVDISEHIIFHYSAQSVFSESKNENL